MANLPQSRWSATGSTRAAETAQSPAGEARDGAELILAAGGGTGRSAVGKPPEAGDAHGTNTLPRAERAEEEAGDARQTLQQTKLVPRLLNMYALLNGRERTIGSMVGVCNKAGWAIVQVYHLPGSLFSEIVVVPA
ncbi:hypothetical protein FB451DRAFT_1395438 [Mycena latifolia]|nr:hypothetical protein FB451DRAFT_1395438 [Mycena latifolia]